MALGMAVLLGAGVNALGRRLPRLGAVAGVLVMAGVVLNNPAMWRIDMIEDNLNRPEELPDYWLDAADALDAGGGGNGGATRVWEVPGSDFASYRWGNTVDPITPGLIERGYVARELVPFGSPQSASLLGALDRRLQEDTLDPASLAPAARLMSVGDVVHRADLIFERYRTPRPVETAEILDRAPGLQPTQAFGDPVPNVAGPQQYLIDEIHLARPADAAHPAPVTRYEIADPLPLLRTRPVAGATVLVGGADGIVTAAGAGVLELDRPLVYAADLAADESLAETVLSHPAHIVVTDTNRRRAQLWRTLRENQGHTEQAYERPLIDDESDSRVAVFDYDAVEANGTAADDVRTVSEQRGPVAAQATAYGNPVSFTNDDRPYNAVDGSLDTAWSVAAFSEARGERLRLTLAEPAFVEGMRLVQTLSRPEQHTAETERHVTEIELRIDGRRFDAVALDERSRSPEGQVIPVGRTLSEIEIEITATSIGHRVSYAGVAPVGFAEVDLGLGPVLEVIRTPRALLDLLGTDLADHRVTVVLTRERSNPREPVRTDPELQIVRAVPLGDGLEVTVSGTARLAATAPSELIDSLVGTGPSASAPVSASSSGRLAGDLLSRASAVLDGDPATAWTGRFGPQSGQWLELRSSAPFNGPQVEIDVVVDELHSTPTAVQVLVDGANAGTFELGLSGTSTGSRLDETATVGVPLRRSGTTVRLVFDRVDERLTREWYSNGFVALPVSVAEVRIEGARLPAPPADIDTGCRDDLVFIDGAAVPVRVTGSVADALARRGLRFEGCASVSLGPPESLVVAAPGSRTGFDIDQLVLEGPRLIPPPSEGVGRVDAVRHRDTAYTVRVPARDDDRWLVLGQSHSRGWHATVDGTDLGPPTVIDGFANAWLLPAGEAATVELRWTPQRLVDWALRLSVLAVAAAAVIAWRGRRDRRGPALARPEPGRPLLRLLWHRETSARPSVAAAVVTAAAVTALAALSLPDWHVLAPAAGLTVVLALRCRRLWWLAPMVAALSLGCAAPVRADPAVPVPLPAGLLVADEVRDGPHSRRGRHRGLGRRLCGRSRPSPGPPSRRHRRPGPAPPSWPGRAGDRMIRDAPAGPRRSLGPPIPPASVGADAAGRGRSAAAVDAAVRRQDDGRGADPCRRGVGLGRPGSPPGLREPLRPGRHLGHRGRVRGLRSVDHRRAPPRAGVPAAAAVGRPPDHPPLGLGRGDGRDRHRLGGHRPVRPDRLLVDRRARLRHGQPRRRPGCRRAPMALDGRRRAGWGRPAVPGGPGGRGPRSGSDRWCMPPAGRRRDGSCTACRRARSATPRTWRPPALPRCSGACSSTRCCGCGPGAGCRFRPAGARSTSTSPGSTRCRGKRPCRGSTTRLSWPRSSGWCCWPPPPRCGSPAAAATARCSPSRCSRREPSPNSCSDRATTTSGS